VPATVMATIVVNMITGIIIWEDWRVITQWMAYGMAHLIMLLGVYLLAPTDAISHYGNKQRAVTMTTMLPVLAEGRSPRSARAATAVVDASRVDASRKSLTQDAEGASPEPSGASDAPLPALQGSPACSTPEGSPVAKGRQGDLCDLGVPSLAHMGVSTVGELGAGFKPSARELAGMPRAREVSFAGGERSEGVTPSGRERRLTSAEAWREALGVDNFDAMERQAALSIAGISRRSRVFSNTRTHTHSQI